MFKLGFRTSGIVLQSRIETDNGVTLHSGASDSDIAFIRRDASICIARLSYGNVSGWLAGCPSQPVLYQND